MYEGHVSMNKGHVNMYFTEKYVIVSILVIWDGTENVIDNRSRPGLHNEPLSVMSNTHQSLN